MTPPARPQDFYPVPLAARPQIVLIPAQPPEFFRHLPVGLAASLPERVQEPLAIIIVPEDILALIPAVHEVIHRPGILKAQLARQGEPLPANPGSVISED